MIKIPAKIEYVIDVLQKNGFKAYIVGGCVRDSILGKVPYDYDVTTNAHPCDIQRLFEKTIPTGIKHGTVTVMLDKTPVEVTTFRTENGYSDSRHPKSVTFVTDVKDDLSRRDFTVNALAYNKTEGLIDCFGGEKDLQKGILKAVGVAEERFNEDALRILRLFRFACVLDFKIDKNTLSAAINTAPLLKNISKERIFTELYKMAASGNLNPISPLLDCGGLEFLKLKSFNTSAIKPTTKSDLAFFSFLYYASCNLDFTLNELKASNALKKYCLTLLELENMGEINSKSSIKTALCKTSADTLNDYFEFSKLHKGYDTTPCLALLNEILENGEPYLISHLKLNGDDLLAFGITGKKSGEILKHLQGLVIENPALNTKENLTKIVNDFIS